MLPKMRKSAGDARVTACIADFRPVRHSVNVAVARARAAVAHFGERLLDARRHFTGLVHSEIRWDKLSDDEPIIKVRSAVRHGLHVCSVTLQFWERQAWGMFQA